MSVQIDSVVVSSPVGKCRFFYDPKRDLVAASISTTYGKRLLRQDEAESRRDLVRSALDILHQYDQQDENDVTRMVNSLGVTYQEACRLAELGRVLRA